MSFASAAKFQGCTLRYEVSTRIASLGSEVDDVIAGSEDVQVVFDQDDGVALVDQPVKQKQELVDVRIV